MKKQLDDLTQLAIFLDKANGRKVRVDHFILTLDDGCEADNPYGCCASYFDAGELIDLLPKEFRNIKPTHQWSLPWDKQLRFKCSECRSRKREEDMMPEGNEQGDPCCVECWSSDD